MANMIQGEIHKGVLKIFNIKKLILMKRQSNVPQEKLQCEERGHVMPDTVALYGHNICKPVTIRHTATNAGAIQVH